MRFALRNKTKLINAFDEDYYNLLIESLKQYFANNETIHSYSIEGEKCQFIDVPNEKKYDVLTLAYYSCFG